MNNSIRSMILSDIAEIETIERQVQLFPWTQQKFKDALNAGYAALVFVEHNRIQAYALMMLGVDDAEILTIAVAKSAQRRGIGRLLLRNLIESAQQAGKERILLEVADKNSSALALYLSLGFSKIGLRKNYYQNGTQKMNALVFALNLCGE